MTRITSPAFLSALLLLSAPSALAITVTEPPDHSNGAGGTVHALAVGANSISGVVTTPSDGQDNFSVSVPPGTQLTAVNLTLNTGSGFSGFVTFNLNETRSNSGAFTTGLPANSGGGFGAGGSYTVQVAADFAVGNAWTMSFTVVALGNNAPTNVNLSSSSVAENAAVNTTVGTLSSTDGDLGNTFTYSLVAGTGSTNNASFNIAGSTLRTSAAFNFETQNSYAIRVRTTDQGGLFFERAFTISVTNVNETPTDLALSFASVAENSGIGQPVGALSSTDPDAANTFTYAIVPGADGALFSISGSTLQVAGALDFEAGTTRTLTIRTTDQGGLTTQKAFTVTLTNVNETPTSLALNNLTAVEATANVLVGTLSTVDPDAANTFGYSIVGGADAAQFTIAGNTLRSSGTLDFEAGPTRAVIVRSTDQGGLSTQQAFTITVTNVNESPTDIGLSAQVVAENATNATVGTLSTIDPDVGNTFTYSIAATGDGAQFAIVGNTLRVAGALNFEAGATRTITLVSTDQGSLFTSRNFTITVTNVNEAPTDLALSGLTVAENVVGGTVGTVSTVDPDVGNTFTLAIVPGGDAAQFTLVGNTLRTAGSLDFEAGATRTLTLSSTDQGSLSTQKAITITVTNVNEAPTDLALSNTSVFEYAPNMTVGSLTAVDPDVGDTFTWTLLGTDAAAFTLVGNVLQVGATGLRRSDGATRTITLRATDLAGLTFEKTVTITLLPFDTSTCNVITVTPSSIANGAIGQPLTSVSMMATLAELPVTFALTGALPAGVTLSGGTISGTPVEAGSFTATVTATDNRGCTGTTPITLVVTCPVSVGMSQTVCGPAQTLALGGTVPAAGVTGIWDDGNAGGTFLPSASSPDATYTAAATFSGTVTLTWSLLGAGCDGTSTNVAVTVGAPGPTTCCNAAADCDDGDPCTADSCATSACTHVAMACTSDAGSDAGMEEDAGTTADAGVADAGTTTDAGLSEALDAGTGGNMDAPGCGCVSSTGSSWVWVLGLATLFMRRRGSKR